jgi:hypothetical protein
VTPEDINRDRWQEMEMGQRLQPVRRRALLPQVPEGEQVSKGPDTFCPNFQRFQQLLDAD